MADNFLNSLLSIPVLILIPIFAGLMVLSPFFPVNTVKIRRFSKGFGIFAFIYSLFFMLASTAEYGSIEAFPLLVIPNFNISLSFGLDNLSSVMLVLASFIILMALIAAKSMINSKAKLFYGLMLLLEGIIFGIFTAGDLFTFFVFWETELIPLYLLISMWGGNKAKKSAMKFVIFTFAGSIFMLISIALIYAYTGDIGISSDLKTLAGEANGFPVVMQLVSSIGFLLAFGVKLPVFGLHTWLADAHSDAPAPVSMVLAGIILKTGAYGLIRINLQMFYDIFQLFAPALIVLGALNVIWASFLAISQNNIKRIIAFSSIANMGIILIGIASLTEFGLIGSIFHMIAHGIIAAGLFAGCGVILMKFKTLKLGLLGGIAKFVPEITVLMMILGISAVGIPFTMGFPGEILSFAGGFSSPVIEKEFFLSNFVQTAVIISALGLVLSGAYILKLLHKTFFGPEEYNFGEIRLSSHQIAVLAVFAAAALVFGLYPMGIIDKISSFAALNIENITGAIF